MSLPVSELIAQNILSTIAGVTVANGYNYSLTVQRHTVAGDKRDHLNAIIVQDDPKEVSDGVYNTKEWLLPFAIGIYVMPADNDTTPIDTYVNVIVADVQKALMIDRYRGGNAMDTNCRAAKIQVDEKSLADIAIVNVDVSYRTSELNPYVRA